MTLDEIMKVNPISYARDRLGFDCNNKGLARLPFCLSCIFADLILDNSDLQMILSERPMKEKGVGPKVLRQPRCINALRVCQGQAFYRGEDRSGPHPL
jgi:hypothetical protein